MKKPVKRLLPPAITFAAGITAATLIFAPFNPANADSVARPITRAVTATAAQNADLTVAAAKAANRTTIQRLATKAPPAPSENQSIKIGDEQGRITYWKISSKKLWVDGVDTGWITRYDVHVRRADGRVVFDKNLSVYKLSWFVNHFKVNKKYGSWDALVVALKDAASTTEVNARAAFKKSVGSLGEARTKDGKTLTPYDPSKHPGKPYVPLNYDGI